MKRFKLQIIREREQAIDQQMSKIPDGTTHLYLSSQNRGLHLRLLLDDILELLPPSVTWICLERNGFEGYNLNERKALFNRLIETNKEFYLGSVLQDEFRQTQREAMRIAMLSKNGILYRFFGASTDQCLNHYLCEPRLLEKIFEFDSRMKRL